MQRWIQILFRTARLVTKSFAALTISCSFGFAEDVPYSTVGWWSIGYRSIDNLSGCQAVASFRDQTSITIALIRREDSSDKNWTLFISNPLWNWVSTNKQYTLLFFTTKPWNGIFYANDYNTLWSNVSIDFMNSMADANVLRIARANKNPLATLDMKDSTAAIQAVVNCVREHSLAPPPEAKISPPSESMISGTGFFVTPNLVLTNFHVVKSCRTAIHVRFPERPSYEATLIGHDNTNDLALLQTQMPNFLVAPFRFQPRLGEPVATYGFPYSGILSSSGNFTLGNITSLSGIRDDTRFLQISTPIQPGNSGGPLLDLSGRVIGIVVAQLSARAMMEDSGSVPQNVNFAIRAPIALSFLSAKGITPTFGTSGDAPELSASALAEMAQKLSVQVYCNETSQSTVQANPLNPRSPDVPPGPAQIESPTFKYTVDGLRLGGRIRFDSAAYLEYECNPSDQFEGFTWCHKSRADRERRGSFTASYSLLHSSDGTMVYINRSQQPAFWAPGEVNSDIRRLSDQFKEQPRIISMPISPGLPSGSIAIWGKVTLEPLDNTSISLLAEGGSPKKGILVDFIANLIRSAKLKLPIYRVSGGAGFVWSASYDQHRRGSLRFFAVNAAAYSAHVASQAHPSNLTSYPRGERN